MAKKNEFINPPEKDVVNVIPKAGTVDLTSRVKMVSTKHPFRNEGEQFEVSPVVAEKFKANGWAKEVK